jgi:hypothetical protein
MPGKETSNKSTCKNGSGAVNIIYRDGDGMNYIALMFDVYS